jgi:D-alanyl-D-alanine carboxypeptidase
MHWLAAFQGRAANILRRGVSMSAVTVLRDSPDDRALAQPLTRRRVLPRLVLPLLASAGCRAEAVAPLAQSLGDVFRQAHAGGFNGSALVMRAGSILYQGSFGLADEQLGIANADATRYLGFSVNKPMTAVLVFQQIQSGKLALERRLADVFAHLANRPAGAITVAQLLSHTSGVEEIISAHPDRRIKPADLQDARVGATGKATYSSSGFVILALALEEVTGRSYAQLFDQALCGPAGMRSTGLLRSGDAVPDLARGYSGRLGRREPSPLGVAPEVLEGAGSVYTTIADLGRFDQALRDGTLLNAQTQKAMLTRVTDDRAYGWSLDEQGGQYFPWHKGSFRGYSAVLVRQVHRQEVIAILSNDEDADVLGLRTQVLRLLKRDAAAR